MHLKYCLTYDIYENYNFLKIYMNIYNLILYLSVNYLFINGLGIPIIGCFYSNIETIFFKSITFSLTKLFF